MRYAALLPVLTVCYDIFDTFSIYFGILFVNMIDVFFEKSIRYQSDLSCRVIPLFHLS